MKNPGLLLTAFIVLILSQTGLAIPSDPLRENQYNIRWDTQSKNAAESMPVTGGDIACNVWVENGELLFYMSRSGSFSENGTYLKLGRIRINLTPNPFGASAPFSQELMLRDGFIEIAGTTGTKNEAYKTKIRVWVEVFDPVIHVDIQSAKPVAVEAAYESWRTNDRELAPGPGGERFSCFNLEGYPGKVTESKDIIVQTKDGILFYHRNPVKKLIPEVLIQQQGLEAFADKITDDLKNRTSGGMLTGTNFIPAGEGEGIYLDTPFKSWKIKSKQSGKDHHLMVVTNIGQTETVAEWKEQLRGRIASSSVNNKTAFEKTTSWWNNFWERSWIFISPENPDPKNPAWQMSRNYQLFRYQLGGNAFGEYPTKFNGGSLTFDPGLIEKEHAYNPDWRKWGGSVFTAQNQRLVYWPMLKSGDFDAILPQFELYRKGLPGATARVAAHFGHEGAVYGEYTSIPGMAFGDGYGWKGESSYRNRGVEIPFGDPRANASRGYNDLAEKGVMANGSVAYHWESQLEHASMILQFHRFSGKDISIYMPFIRAAVLFFDEHYQIREKMRTGQPLGKDGKLVIYPSTSCESYRGAKNPADLIAGLRACLTGLLDLDGKYLTQADKDYYRGFLSRVPDYTFAEVNGLKIIKPAAEWLTESNQELPQFYPLFPFDQFKIGDNEIQVFKNTYALAPAFRKGVIQSWHQDGIQFARMGMTKEAADYNTRKLKDSDRRYPTFWGPGHDWVPDHNHGGSGMIGLQEMLMQTFGDKILLFPAWPKEWDVDFKLHAPNNTTVEGVLANGKLISLKVTPESRRKDVVITMNPGEK